MGCQLATGATKLQSTFTPDVDPSPVSLPVSSANSIHFHRIVCTIAMGNGRYSLTESNDVEKGLLDQDTLFLIASDRGKTKDVFRV